MVHFFSSLAGPRDKQVVFAIRAELGLTPQMDVGPYAYAEIWTYSIVDQLVALKN